MRDWYIIFAAILQFSISSLHAETWGHGALTLHEVSGELRFTRLGMEATTLDVEQVPISTAGLINLEGAYGTSAFLSASNRVNFYFEGSGSFAVERFEQIIPDSKSWESSDLETGKSRMILNFRAGDLIVDSRKLHESSQCLVETPLGRLSVQRALWQMRIAFDPRSQVFDFIITCSEGRVRFTDLQGQVYALRAGQRLAGVGARNEPSIEVGERTESSLEQMQRYEMIADAHQQAASGFAQYSKYIRPIEPSARKSGSAPTPSIKKSTRRPIVIEYADDPAAVTPFRGHLKPPANQPRKLF